MKYQVHIKWQCIATVEAENQDDAINYVLHSAMRPKLAETTAVPVVEGKVWMHATADAAPENEYKANRRAKALARWKQAYEMRATGLIWDKVGAKLGVDGARACVMATNYEEYLLNQRTQKQAA